MRYAFMPYALTMHVFHRQNAHLERQTRDLDKKLVAHQRAQARPYPYHFEIRPVEP